MDFLVIISLHKCRTVTIYNCCTIVHLCNYIYHWRQKTFLVEKCFILSKNLGLILRPVWSYVKSITQSIDRSNLAFVKRRLNISSRRRPL